MSNRKRQVLAAVSLLGVAAFGAASLLTYWLDATLAGFMRRLRPDYVLIDSAIGCEVGGGPVWAAPDKYTVDHCALIGQMDGAWLGDPGKRTNLLGQTTSVYQCNA